MFLEEIRLIYFFVRNRTILNLLICISKIKRKKKNMVPVTTVFCYMGDGVSKLCAFPKYFASSLKMVDVSVQCPIFFHIILFGLYAKKMYFILTKL